MEKWANLKQEIQKKLTSSNFPKPGDKIFAKYFQCQYFPAAIDYYDTAAQNFHISWDDNDTAGRIVAVGDVALNRIPDLDQIGLGSHVLFQQGQYGSKDSRSGGYRWHMGEITNIKNTLEGILFDGQHVYGEEDGKWVTYKDFSQTFSGLTLDQLRVSPNLLDAYDVDDVVETEIPQVDMFVCYSDKNTITGSKPTNIDPMRIICEIENQFKIKTNLKIRNPSTIQVVGMIKKATVFLAIISNEFAADQKCQQQFQYAKKSRGCPVIPTVVGNDFGWTKTVVGLLIAGELYIHFRDESVFSDKFQELSTSVNRILKPMTFSEEGNKEDTKPCIGFISYCWTNSLSSKEAKQVPHLVGNEFSDPRKIKTDLEIKLTRITDHNLWLDIEKIGTSDNSDLNATIFEQVAAGLANAKIFLAFVSSEYSKSENCEMEFCHAVKTIGIPLIPILVGERKSEDWKMMQVGMIVGASESKNDYSARIDFRELKTEDDYNSKLDDVADRIQKILETKSEENEKPQKVKEIRAPKIGLVLFDLQWLNVFFDPVEQALIALMNHRCRHQKTGLFITETMMRHQCNIDETLMISIQTLNIINVFFCANLWNIDF